MTTHKVTPVELLFAGALLELARQSGQRMTRAPWCEVLRLIERGVPIPPKDPPPAMGASIEPPDRELERAIDDLIQLGGCGEAQGVAGAKDRIVRAAWAMVRREVASG